MYPFHNLRVFCVASYYILIKTIYGYVSITNLHSGHLGNRQ